MPFLIEIMFPEWAVYRISLMLTFAIGAFEGMGAEFTLLYFKSGRGDFVIGLAAPCKFSVVDGLMRVITFDALCLLDSANVCSVASFPAIFTLGDAVKIADGGLHFYFLFSLYFLFLFYFLFLEQLGLGFVCHTVTSVTRLITRLGRIE